MTQISNTPTLHTATVPVQIADALCLHHAQTAFVNAEMSLTYGQLAVCIQRLENHLPAQGPVAVFGKPSVIFATAVTACVVLGRPFVHLDPAMPKEVLMNILSELEIDTVFQCQNPKAGQLPQGCTIVDVPTVIESPEDTPEHPVIAGNVGPDDTIYIVATSGTTGKPKCIPVTQQAAYLSYEWRDAYTPYDPDQTVGIYIFAIWEMFRPLRNGARLCFPSFKELLNPDDLAAFLIRYNVTEMLFTPSALEKTLQTSTVSMTKVSDSNDGSVGIAMPHLRAVVLNDHDQECEIGQTGLLHFEGLRMLGPSYVNRIEETTLRFRNLDLNRRQTRLYDTGDQGYVSADGKIHVLGRVAHMLKLRGHSIQTNELTESLQNFLGFTQRTLRVRSFIFCLYFRVRCTGIRDFLIYKLLQHLGLNPSGANAGTRDPMCCPL